MQFWDIEILAFLTSVYLSLHESHHNGLCSSITLVFSEFTLHPNSLILRAIPAPSHYLHHLQATPVIFLHLILRSPPFSTTARRNGLNADDVWSLILKERRILPRAEGIQVAVSGCIICNVHCRLVSFP